MSAQAANEIAAMHAAYCRATGFQITLDITRERQWFEVWKRGIRVADVALLVGHLRDGIKRQERNPGCLKFRNFVGNADYLEEDLQEARARARVVRPNPARASVLQASGRPAAPEPPPARPAGAVIDGSEIARRLAQFRKEELG